MSIRQWRNSSHSQISGLGNGFAPGGGTAQAGFSGNPSASAIWVKHSPGIFAAPGGWQIFNRISRQRKIKSSMTASVDASGEFHNTGKIPASSPWSLRRISQAAPAPGASHGEASRVRWFGFRSNRTVREFPVRGGKGPSPNWRALWIRQSCGRTYRAIRPSWTLDSFVFWLSQSAECPVRVSHSGLSPLFRTAPGHQKCTSLG